MFDVEGEEGFRIREEKVIGELAEQQGIVLATGGGAIKSRETRNKLSARGIVVYLETTIEKQLARTQRQASSLAAKPKSRPVKCFERLAQERNALYEEVADFVIQTDDQSAKVVANQIVKLIGM